MFFLNMKNKFLAFFVIIFLLNSCGGISDAGKVLRNEKTRTTDEFLVKKREPLSLPPEYKEIPEPGSISKTQKSQKDEFKNILKKQKSNNVKKKGSSTTEQSILKQITKWRKIIFFSIIIYYQII